MVTLRDITGVKPDGDEPKTKLLKIIHEALITNPKVFIAGDLGMERGYHPERQILPTIEYVVAPTEGIYELDDLNGFMVSLVPRVPTETNHAYIEDGFLFFGETVFLDRFATMHKVIKTKEERLQDYAGFVKGEKILKPEPLSRRISIRVCPDEEIARFIFGCDMTYDDRVSLKELPAFKVQPQP